MNLLKAALFDLDGVIFDTEPQYTNFWGSQCRLYHPEHPGLEYEIKGQTLTQIFDQWFSGPLAKEQDIITQRLNEFESKMTFDYIEGFETLCHDLRANDVKIAVVTSSNQEKMKSVYQYQPEFLHLVDEVLTSEDFSFSKPHPDCYLKAASRFGAQPSQCIVFEDSINGLRSGQAAEMTVVGLTTTNSVELVKPLSDIQVSNYNNMTAKMLEDCIKQHLG